jgi:solute carrier family 25 carnitine/acylcarnitine transporter 20/29
MERFGLVALGPFRTTVSQFFLVLRDSDLTRCAICAVEVNNTVIYFITRPIPPPTDALASALPKLHLSSFLAAIFSTSLADVIKATPRSTILIPHNKGFERLGMLVSDHLLSSAGKSDLTHVIMHHVVDGVYYSNSLANVSAKSIPTIDGSDLRLVNSSLTASGGWPGMTSDLKLKDLITETGARPRTLWMFLYLELWSWTVGKAGSSRERLFDDIYAGLKAGFEWVLECESLHLKVHLGQRWDWMGLDGRCCVRPDNAFKHVNMTELLEGYWRGSRRSLVNILFRPHHRQIFSIRQSAEKPKDGENRIRPISLHNDATYSTLHLPEQCLWRYRRSLIEDSLMDHLSWGSKAQGGPRPKKIGLRLFRGVGQRQEMALEVLSRSTGCLSPYRSTLVC